MNTLKKIVEKITSFLFPANSRRFFGLRILADALEHPRTMLRVINPTRVKNFLFYLKTEGMDGVKKRYRNTFEIESMHSRSEGLFKVEFVKDTGKQRQCLDDYEKLVLPHVSVPEVSIVIPVYNEFDYTYNCIRSIQERSGNISYEILIADDCSSDLTTHIEEIIENVRRVTTKSNMGFLRNCNNAAQHACGQYIVFLNNDTQVQKDWLSPLLSLIKRDRQIGMVGSRLIYPEGFLQEAGGIIWKDASAWNYGNRQCPEGPEYNYVKECDYISGASIMIRRDLWKEIGGFDERFAPAYCEDSDLAFEVRAKGYKVMYQPLSVVAHFEGISNGTDTNVGQKAYQVINQKKFLEKWKDVLEKEHFVNGENVLLARDRSQGKPVLLMIDHYVPQYDKDAGSRTVFSYLKLFVKMGYNVKFLGDDFYRYEPYTTVLQQMGIEVLYGPRYSKGWAEWVRKNGDHIRYVFLNRPHVSVKYIDFIKSETNAKIIYYGHDLHFLRFRRQYELTHDKKTLKDSEDWKKKELALMHKADRVYYPSCVEVKEIAKLAPDVKAKAIVAYIFEENRSKAYDYNERKDIMFVGGFSHTPNIDAVIWFVKEILPVVKKEYPDIKFYILGSNPPAEVRKLEDQNVIVKGFVSDEELERFYEKCRISVVPLRYGAGIKGKVIEALNYGIPVVTTTTGAEGIIGAERILCIEDSAEKFGSMLSALYGDEQRLTEMSMLSHEYICSHYSAEAAWNVIKEDFS